MCTWSGELPHQLYREQQDPHCVSAHVTSPPQRPSVDALSLEVAPGLGLFGGVVVAPPPPPPPPAPLDLETSRYQNSAGSPMHSPTVTGFKPLLAASSSMNCHDVAAARQAVLDLALGALHLGLVAPVVRVDVPLDDVVAETPRLRQAVGVAAAVRRAQHVDKGLLGPHDLVPPRVGVERGHVLVRPRVVRDLVALGHHAPDQAPPRLALERPLAVVGRDEEGRLGVVLLQKVQHVLGVDAGSVVKAGPNVVRCHGAA
ncbi:hypothetical protein PpBr36_03399 [Pyricularia pennisetigena]|uniref:hypothetical protein n=1 Tax=Pyricularia pennisetigena TaxID=1578925 RepID=UPI00114F8000|nr:hypothetical protein PpBr36_03399 [Pyricularia pennisetigena]TLS31476.1 hypothetical protein PpBr36_03399 [Pyricularia pennisetigena]